MLTSLHPQFTLFYNYTHSSLYFITSWTTVPIKYKFPQNSYITDLINAILFRHWGTRSYNSTIALICLLFQSNFSVISHMSRSVKENSHSLRLSRFRIFPFRKMFNVDSWRCLPLCKTYRKRTMTLKYGTWHNTWSSYSYILLHSTYALNPHYVRN